MTGQFSMVKAALWLLTLSCTIVVLGANTSRPALPALVCSLVMMLNARFLAEAWDNSCVGNLQPALTSC
jgi:4-amino-4-deoxy-L-arabinose transferase-like glycosyltransferase